MKITKRTPFNPTRKPMPQQSAKKRAYRASSDGRAALAHMQAIKALPCIVCGAAPPSEAHHCRSDCMARDDLKTIPLCKPCHLLYHARKRTWHKANGKDYDLLPIVAEMLNKGD